MLCLGPVSSHQNKMALLQETYRPYIEYCVQFWSPPFKIDVDRPERVQRRATKTTKGLENLSSAEKLQLYSFFTRSYMKMIKGNRYKLYWERFPLDRRKKFLTMRIINHWDNLPKDMAEPPLLEVYKMQLDQVPDNLIQAPLFP